MNIPEVKLGIIAVSRERMKEGISVFKKIVILYILRGTDLDTMTRNPFMKYSFDTHKFRSTIQEYP